eukprot:g18503.t1
MGKLVQAHKKKRKKALARKKKFAKQLRGEKTLLEYASIKEPARKDYCRKLEGFYAFVVKYEMDIRNENLLDAALCEYAEHLYLDGEDSHYGQKLRAALEFDRPEFSREGGLALPRFKRALKGWRRLAPTQTRLPTPEMLKACVSGIFLHKGWKEEALFNEVTFSTYARPGETLRVMAEDSEEEVEEEVDTTTVFMSRYYLRAKNSGKPRWMLLSEDAKYKSQKKNQEDRNQSGPGWTSAHHQPQDASQAFNFLRTA